MVNQKRVELPRLGTRKLYHLLKAPLRELGVGRDRLFSILRVNHMLIEPKRQYHVTTNSYHRFYKHKNTAKHVKLIHPEQLWVADITYVGNRKNPMYLALITDAYSKRIMGYDTSNSLSSEQRAVSEH
jgi:putative transposase